MTNQKGFVIATTDKGNVLTPVEIIQMDDPEPVEVGGRVFAGNGEDEVLIHFSYLDRPDEWLPSDTVCLKLSDKTAEDRVYGNYDGLKKREHSLTCK